MLDEDARHSHIVAVLFVATFAIAASFSGLMNGFALDDVHIIFENHRVHGLSEAWRLFGQTLAPRRKCEHSSVPSQCSRSQCSGSQATDRRFHFI